MQAKPGREAELVRHLARQAARNNAEATKAHRALDRHTLVMVLTAPQEEDYSENDSCNWTCRFIPVSAKVYRRG